MKFYRLAAVLALFPLSALAQQAPAQQSPEKAAFFGDIEAWRATQLPRSGPLASRLEPRLDEIKTEVAQARADSELAKPRRAFEAWKKELLREKFSEARSEGLTRGSLAQYSAEQTRQAEFSSRLHSLLAQAVADRFAETRRKSASAAVNNPGAFFDGAGERGGGGVTASAPLDLKDPARYSKVRQILISQGASPRVVDMAIKEAIRQNADPLMVLAVINQESRFNVNATSYRRHKDGSFVLDENGQRIPLAHGLMQLTADKGKNLYDVHTNLRLGVAYLKQMWSRFVGEEMTAVSAVNDYVSHGVKSAVAAYNAGPGAVHKYSGVPPYRETQGYVKRVLGYYSRFQQYTDA